MYTARENGNMELFKYLDTAACIFLVINKNHTVELINKKGCEVLGYERYEVEGKDWFQNFIPDSGREELLSFFDSVIENQIEDIECYQGKILTKKRGLRTINWRSSLLTDNGVITGLISSGEDITHSLETHSTLFLRNRALEAAGNGIIIVDANEPDMPIIYCNSTFSKLTGYRRSEVFGKNCRFLQKDDRDQEAIGVIRKAIKKGESCRVVLRNYRKDGSMFWNELTITPLYDEKEKLTHFIGIQNDVTEIQEYKEKLEHYTENLENMVEKRTEELKATVQKLVETNLSLEDQIINTKYAERKSQESQALTSAIAQNFPRGVIIVFNSDYDIVYVEGEELQHIDLKKSDFEGKSIDQIPFFSDAQVRRIKHDILNTFKGKSLSFEVDYQDSCYKVNTMPLYSDNGEIMWALFVFSNITELKQAQHELAKALETEKELNELKSRFISMASHEFRTPLSAILSSAILIGRQNEPGKEERRQKHVERIRSNVKNLVVILNDFLSLSKLEEGKVNVNPQQFELIGFSELLVDEMEASKKQGQKIVLKTEEKEILLYQDPKMLSHILMNLLSNATKYSAEGKQILLQIEKNKEKVILKVYDEGIGIPKNEQKDLFERFFRATNATNIQGTGLGLHIVKQYTELMGGEVSFKSEIGKGSVFIIQLPLNLNGNAKDITN